MKRRALSLSSRAGEARRGTSPVQKAFFPEQDAQIAVAMFESPAGASHLKARPRRANAQLRYGLRLFALRRIGMTSGGFRRDVLPHVQVGNGTLVGETGRAEARPSEL